jgi:hypothetical protein
MTVALHGVSSSTPSRILIDAGAVYIGFVTADNPGTLLGATKGGNVFELTRTIRVIEPDGAKGPVKGLRRIESVDAVITANMLELTAENLRRALAVDSYSSGTTLVEDEAVGDGDGETTEFALDHGDVVENSETITLEGAAQVRGTDYTMDYDTGTIQFVAAPGSGAEYSIVATYTYVSGDGVLIGEEVPDNAYCDSVAIIGTIQGMTNPIIVKVTNALCDGGLNLSMAPKDEAVVQVKFTGHYTAADLDTEPFSVTYPAS